MRRLAVVALALLAACGGQSPTQPPPPPPPPGTQPGPPASVTVQAGDAQEGEPGKPLAVKPAVLVRDASGRPVPGVTVSFAVDSGGGSAAGSAITGADGIASIDWTMGASDGPAVLTATVAGLPPARIRAIGKFPLVTLLDAATIPAGGGTVTYTKAGDQYSGLTITVPNATFPGPTTFKVEIDRSAHPVFPAGIKQIGPAFLITDGKGFGDSVMAIRFPVHVGGDSILAAFLYDDATGLLEGAAMVARDAGSVTVASKHFSADQMLQPGGLAGLRAAAPAVPAFGKLRMVFAASTPPYLMGSFSSTFAPGTDDWEFTNYGTYGSPKGLCAGMSMTALYYHYKFRPGGPGLYHQFDSFLSLEFDNPQGERFASAIQEDMQWGAAANWITQVQNYASRSFIDYGQIVYQSLAMTLRVTGRPQLLTLASTADKSGHAVVAYAVNNGTVSFADPNYPGIARTMTYDPALGEFQPVSLALRADESPVLMDEITLMGISALVRMRTLDQRWGEFTQKIAGPPYFPVMTRQFYDQVNDLWAPVPANGVILTSHRIMALRTVCPSCPPNRTLGPPRNGITGVKDVANLIQALDINDSDTAAVIVFGRGQGSFQVSMESFYRDPVDHDPMFADQRFLTIVTAPITIVPGPATIPRAVDITLTLEHNNVGGANAKFVWDFGDGTPKVTKTGDSTVVHHWNTFGDYTVTAELQDAAGKKLGGDQTIVTVAAGPFIRFVIDGFWDPLTTPANGSYGYATGFAARTPNPDTTGLDLLFLGYNLAPSDKIGVLVTAVIPVGQAVAVGQTFTLHAQGAAQAGQWKLLLTLDQNDVEGSDQRAPQGTGTLRIDALAPQADGSIIGQYSFTITNPAGGSIIGSGIGQWTYIVPGPSTCSGPPCMGRLP